MEEHERVIALKRERKLKEYKRSSNMSTCVEGEDMSGAEVMEEDYVFVSPGSLSPVDVDTTNQSVFQACEGYDVDERGVGRAKSTGRPMSRGSATYDGAEALLQRVLGGDAMVTSARQTGESCGLAAHKGWDDDDDEEDMEDSKVTENDDGDDNDPVDAEPQDAATAYKQPNRRASSVMMSMLEHPSHVGEAESEAETSKTAAAALFPHADQDL